MITKTRYLDPTNDVSFRKLFGTEGHKPLLISFLNSILSLEGERRIKRVDFLPKDQAPLIKETKESILDIKCTDERNMQYIVEMQNRKVPAFVKRTQFYVAHSYVTQFPSGSQYVELKPVILLAIANHELFPNKGSVISYHKTLDVDTLEHDLEDMSYVFIELPKFAKGEGELETVQDKWLYFFKNWEISGEVPPSIEEEELLEAYHSMEEYNWSLAEREAYVKANIALVDEYDARRKEREEGLEEGLQKGMEKGLEEGEKRRSLEIARVLLQQGLLLEQVIKATGVSKEDLDDASIHS
ncbi:Rpn family recombination-promoting nuclease/putative transposase [Candidatus Neptunochlamydia vexilliferae]|uniref:Rpn family recombination-promoting nuclease/putative transposase n=1 Tax=Candidatus Neptunichlamydia vexilliferae TaxID=1651774 RepID=A0ABS0AZR1_9BACT|nr:Rpn family recombination-promoting nuclease/putative transposase [Candidatus Neptunochlamydia vexilliferae]MBF5059623.1 hypothetical protein [Candidatus Neptunochlamydia vexilliferae]